MVTFTNTTTANQYAKAKEHWRYFLEAGENETIIHEQLYDRAYIVRPDDNGYTLDYTDKYNNLNILFQVDGDTVTIEAATDNGKHYQADKYLTKYVTLLAMITAVLKYERRQA